MSMPPADAGLAPLAAAPRRARAVLALVRWPNALIAAAAVLLGAAWSGRVTERTTLAALAALALAAVANSVNDLCDRDLDRLAHPARPLPSGALGAGDAAAVAGLAALLALLASAAASPALGALSAAVIAAMVWYSVGLKRRGIPGNLLAALLASAPFLYGSWSAGSVGRGAPLFALAVPLHLAREIAKDLDDAPADAAVRRTLPVAAGPRRARAAVLALSVLFALLAVALFARRALPALALVLASVLCVALAGRRVAAGLDGAPRLLKGAMLLAMAAAAADVALRGA